MAHGDREARNRLRRRPPVPGGDADEVEIATPCRERPQQLHRRSSRSRPGPRATTVRRSRRRACPMQPAVTTKRHQRAQTHVGISSQRPALRVSVGAPSFAAGGFVRCRSSTSSIRPTWRRPRIWRPRSPSTGPQRRRRHRGLRNRHVSRRVGATVPSQPPERRGPSRMRVRRCGPPRSARRARPGDWATTSPSCSAPSCALAMLPRQDVIVALTTPPYILRRGGRTPDPASAHPGRPLVP